MCGPNPLEQPLDEFVGVGVGVGSETEDGNLQNSPQ